jgi:hypothetical protein
VQMATSLAAQFNVLPGHPYPGPQLALPAGMTATLDAYFQAHCRERLRVGPALGSFGRFSRVTSNPSTLDGRQRICHRDDSGLEPGQVMSALVHYLFQDQQLGGTVFFRSLMSDQDCQVFLRDAATMDAAAFGDKYGMAPGYMTQSNRYFEVIGRVAAKWNRAAFYNGGIFHSGDIAWSSPAGYQSAMGRLTVNAFFKSRTLDPQEAAPLRGVHAGQPVA